jgi:hypothetical protein
MAQMPPDTNERDLLALLARESDLTLPGDAAPGERHSYVYAANNTPAGCIPSRQGQQGLGNIPHALQGATDYFSRASTFENFHGACFADTEMLKAFIAYVASGEPWSIFGRYQGKLFGLDDYGPESNFPRDAALNDILTFLTWSGGDAGTIKMVVDRLNERANQMTNPDRTKIKLLKGNSKDKKIVATVESMHKAHVNRMQNPCTLEDFERMLKVLTEMGNVTFEELIQTNIEIYLRVVQILVAEAVPAGTPMGEETKSTVMATEYCENGFDPCKLKVPEMYKQAHVQAALLHMMTLMQNQTQSAIALCSHPGCRATVVPTIGDFGGNHLRLLLSLEELGDVDDNPFTSRKETCLLCPAHRRSNERTAPGLRSTENKAGYAQLDPPFAPTPILTKDEFNNLIGQVMDTHGTIHANNAEAFYQSIGAEGNTIPLGITLGNLTALSMVQFGMPDTGSILSFALCQTQGGDPNNCDANIYIGTNRTPECEAKCKTTCGCHVEREEERMGSSLNHIFVSLKVLLDANLHAKDVVTLLYSAGYQTMRVCSHIWHFHFVIRSLVTTEGLLPRGQKLSDFVEDRFPKLNCTGNIREFVEIDLDRLMIAFKISPFSREVATNGSLETMIGSDVTGPLLTASVAKLIAGQICEQEPIYVDNDSKTGNIAIGMDDGIIQVCLFDDESKTPTDKTELCTYYILNPITMEINYLPRSLLQADQTGRMDEKTTAIFLQALVPLASEFPKCSNTEIVDLFMAALKHLCIRLEQLLHVPNLDHREAFQQLLGYEGKIPSVGLSSIDADMRKSRRSLVEIAGWSLPLALVLGVTVVLRQNSDEIDVPAVLECLQREIPEALKIVAEGVNQRLARLVTMAIACTDRAKGVVITDDTGIRIRREEWLKGSKGQAVETLLTALGLTVDALPETSFVPGAAHRWIYMVTQADVNNRSKTKQGRSELLEAMFGCHMTGAEDSTSSAPGVIESWIQYTALQCALEQQPDGSESKVPLILFLLDFAIKRYSTSLVIGEPLEKYYTKGTTRPERIWNAWLGLMNAAVNDTGDTGDAVSRFAYAVVTGPNDTQSFLQRVTGIVDSAVIGSIATQFKLDGEDVRLLWCILTGTVARISDNPNPNLTPPQLITLMTSSMYLCMADIEQRSVDKRKRDSETDSDSD